MIHQFDKQLPEDHVAPNFRFKGLKPTPPVWPNGPDPWRDGRSDKRCWNAWKCKREITMCVSCRVLGHATGIGEERRWTEYWMKQLPGRSGSRERKTNVRACMCVDACAVRHDQSALAQVCANWIENTWSKYGILTTRSDACFVQLGTLNKWQ